MEGANRFPASFAIPTPAGFIHPKADVVGMCSVKGASAIHKLDSSAQPGTNVSPALFQ